VVTTQLTTENISGVRENRLKQLSERSGSVAYMADRAIAARLFGTFPYGQPAGGTPETVSKIDRADLLLARERFLNADNAILVVIGGVAKLRVMRTLRQLVGPWQKSDRMVPATFRPPAAPETRIMLLNQANGTTAEIRLAVRGLARSDRDAAAAALLAQIVRSRWQAAQPDLLSVFVRDEAHLLPGTFVLGGTAPNASAAKAVVVAQQVLRTLAQSGPSAAELEGARAIVLAELDRRASQSESIADLWLDIELFKLAAAPAQASSIQSLTVGDIQRVASRLFKDASIATVVIGDLEQLKATFDGTVELRSEKPNTSSAADPVMPTKKP
jgi:zinc protease